MSLLNSLVLLATLLTIQIHLPQTFFADAAPSDTGNQLEARLEIIPPGPVISLQADKTKSLTCRVLGEAASSFETVRWAGPGDKQKLADNLSFSVDTSSENKSTDLEIDGKPENIGEYYCLATHRNGTTITTSVVTQFSAEFKVKKCDDKQILKIDKPAIISCRIETNNPRVNAVYSFAKKPNVTSADQARYKINQDGISIDGSVRTSDAGIYYIKVKNPETGEVIKREVKVGVEVRPVFENTPRTSYEVKEGDPLTLTCDAIGSPKPKTLWSGPRGRLLPVAGYTVEDGVLNITSSSRQYDHGLFGCNVTNGVGSVYLDIRVSVLAKPGPPTIVEPKTSSPEDIVNSTCKDSFTLKLIPSDYDLGDSEVKFNIKYSLVNNSRVNISGEKNITQSSTQPTKVEFTLETDSRYRFEVQTVNKQGASDPAFVTVDLKSDASPCPQAVTEGELSTEILIAITIVTSIILVVVVVFFQLRHDIGFYKTIRTRCCSSKTASVTSDKLVSHKLDSREQKN